jgi:hypothetical protein
MWKGREETIHLEHIIIYGILSILIAALIIIWWRTGRPAVPQRTGPCLFHEGLLRGLEEWKRLSQSRLTELEIDIEKALTQLQISVNALAEETKTIHKRVDNIEHKLNGKIQTLHKK